MFTFLHQLTYQYSPSCARSCPDGKQSGPFPSESDYGKQKGEEQMERMEEQKRGRGRCFFVFVLEMLSLSTAAR